MPWLRRLLYPVAMCLSLALPASSAPQRAGDGGGDIANVTYTGFRRLPDARSLVYVELSAPVEVRLSQRGTEVTYTLQGAQVPLKNNTNPLNTSAFASNVLLVKIAQVRTPKPKRGSKAPAQPPSVEVTIRLRTAVTPTHALIRGAGGPVLEITIPDAPAT